MCGIFGEVLLRPGDFPGASTMTRMSELLFHRGPDSSKIVQHGAARLGCTRLRVVDLSRAADGPMRSHDGAITLTCNGEIYNSDELRSRYSGYPFATASDIEVILPLYLDQGLSGLEQLVGMFAFALWDERKQTCILMRDPSGEKPLFISGSDTVLRFASEIQPLLEFADVSRELDPISVQDYLQLGYVRSPRTIFRDVQQVPPGSALIASASSRTTKRTWDRWSKESRQESASAPSTADPQELLGHLRQAVRRQSTADVSRGVYLSGGLDSSLLAALLCEVLDPGELTAFTVEFPSRSFDEARWAQLVARDLGLNEQTVVMTEEVMLATWRRALREIADPISDPALLPTIALGEKARDSVTVVYSGEGADELFGGYPTYLGHSLAGTVSNIPRGLRSLIEATLRTLPVTHNKTTLPFLAQRFMTSVDRPWVERHLRWFGPGADSLTTFERPIQESVVDLTDELASLRDGHTSPAAAAMLLDYATYLPDNLLVKLDRGSMLSSIEPRAPFLDPDVVRYAWSQPVSSKVRHGQTKVLLKEAARGLLPREVIHRRKRGLSVPIAAWLNGGLKHEVDRLLEPRRLDRQGIFIASAVHGRLAEHRASAADHSRLLWNVVHFQAWMEQWTPRQVD